MKTLTALFVLLAGLVGVGVFTHSSAKADIVMNSTPTPVPGQTLCKVVNCTLDFKSLNVTVSWECSNGSGTTVSGGSQTFPMPNPTPAAIGTIKTALEKTLAGYPSGSLGQTTPIAISTVVP